MTIYIIILHYGDIKDTVTCLDSITKIQKNGNDIKIILVDNGSKFKDHPDSIGTKLKATTKNLILITNKINLGFAGGINIGIKEALKDKDADYILILNNDTILPKNFLEKILNNPSDITSPVIKFKFGNKWIYDYCGKINWWTGRTKHVERSSKLKIQNPKQIEHIDYVSGCCMLIKREVFEKIGLFDNRFFFYFEDVDFCVRAAKLGFHISVCENSYICHKLGASIGRWSNKAILYNLYSNFLFITKHLGLRSPIGYIYLIILAIKIIYNKIR